MNINVRCLKMSVMQSKLLSGYVTKIYCIEVQHKYIKSHNLWQFYFINKHLMESELHYGMKFNLATLTSAYSETWIVVLFYFSLSGCQVIKYYHYNLWSELVFYAKPWRNFYSWSSTYSCYFLPSLKWLFLENVTTNTVLPSNIHIGP